jgi:hypothetical protein
LSNSSASKHSTAGAPLAAGRDYDSSERRIDEKHLARLQPAVLRDVLRRDLEHARLGRHHDQAVLGHRVTRGTKAVAI